MFAWLRLHIYYDVSWFTPAGRPCVTSTSICVERLVAQFDNNARMKKKQQQMLLQTSHFWAEALIYRAYILFVHCGLFVTVFPLWCDFFYCLVFRLWNILQRKDEEYRQKHGKWQERVVSKTLLKRQRIHIQCKTDSLKKQFTNTTF